MFSTDAGDPFLARALRAFSGLDRECLSQTQRVPFWLALRACSGRVGEREGPRGGILDPKGDSQTYLSFGSFRGSAVVRVRQPGPWTYYNVSCQGALPLSWRVMNFRLL